MYVVAWSLRWPSLNSEYHEISNILHYIALWFSGSLVRRFCDSLVSWPSGSMAPRISGPMALYPSGSRASWLTGSFCFLVLQRSGSLALWFNGSLALCLSGSRALLLFGTMALWLFCFLFGSLALGLSQGAVWGCVWGVWGCVWAVWILATGHRGKCSPQPLAITRRD